MAVAAVFPLSFVRFSMEVVLSGTCTALVSMFSVYRFILLLIPFIMFFI